MQRRTLLKSIAAGYAALAGRSVLAQDGSIVAPIDAATAARMQHKAKHFDNDFEDDFYLTSEQKNNLLMPVMNKMAQAKKIIGFGFFNLLSFDDLLKTVARSPSGAFTKAELDFIEATFFRDAREYGF